MKQIAFTLMLFVIALSPLAAVCQALPDNPQPAQTGTVAQSTPAPPTISDREWRNIERIRYGAQISVASTYGPPLRCRFSSATDAALFCDEPGSPDGTGFRFDRAAVTYVEDLAPEPKPNHHPAWLSCMIAGGILTGLAAVGNTDAGHAAAAGALGAVIVGAIGAPMALMNGSNTMSPGPVIYGSRTLVSIPIGRFRLPHSFIPIPR